MICRTMSLCARVISVMNCLSMSPTKRSFHPLSQTKKKSFIIHEKKQCLHHETRNPHLTILNHLLSLTCFSLCAFQWPSARLHPFLTLYAPTAATPKLIRSIFLACAFSFSASALLSDPSASSCLRVWCALADSNAGFGSQRDSVGGWCCKKKKKKVFVKHVCM